MEGKIELYKTLDNQTELNVQFENDTVWLSQLQMAELFDRDRTVISRHISNIFTEKELDKSVVCAKFAHTTQHGAIKGKEQKKVTEYYNLDVIISVGYRVKSQRGTQFRQWATQRLKDFLVQGYAINEKRLAQKQKEVEYFITKNHSFVDGNKRIAAACFLYFMQSNNGMKRANGKALIDNATLAALTLFIATSKTEEAEVVKKIVVSVLNRNNESEFQ